MQIRIGFFLKLLLSGLFVTFAGIINRTRHETNFYTGFAGGLHDFFRMLE